MEESERRLAFGFHLTFDSINKIIRERYFVYIFTNKH